MSVAVYPRLSALLRAANLTVAELERRIEQRFGLRVDPKTLYRLAHSEPIQRADLGLEAPAGATLRQLRERYVTQGHLDTESATAMRRVTATLEKARYDRPERTTPQEAIRLHHDIRSIRRQVGGTRAWKTRVRSFLWPR